MKKLLVLMGLSLMFTGCASKTWLVQPEFNPLDVKRIGVVVPNATVKMLDVANNVTIDQDLCVAARSAIEKGSVDAIKERGFDAFLLTNKNDVVTFLKGYGPISVELSKHFPNGGVPTTPSKIEGFDQIRKNNNLDCVVSVEGLDHKSTAGRKARLAAAALLGISGGHGLTYVRMDAYCGADGKPMYTEMFAKSEDLTSASDVEDMVGKLVDHMKAITYNK